METAPRFGWIPDYPDFRDYTERTPSVREILAPTGLALPQGGVRAAERKRGKKALPAAVSLRPHCSPVEDQGGLGSCTAQAGAGVIEYYERRAFGRHIDASRLFLYKVTRNLMKMKGDTGAYLRTTMGAMVLFGVPPEEYWPYSDGEDKFDREPPAFCYSFAQNYKTIQYYRHDALGAPGALGASPAALLERLKTHLAAGHPSMFGFTVYSSIEKADERGAIPFPSERDRILGGHAVVAVGYDNALTIKNPSSGGPTTKGALLIRNSWGASWGDGGYGWLPYKYVEAGLAEDFWSVLKKDWVDTGAFNV
jgi:C1A family cysteine protease